MLLIKPLKVNKIAVEGLKTLAIRMNEYILAKYGEQEPVLNEGNLEFCLGRALERARKSSDFHQAWASHTLLNLAKIHPFIEGNKRTSYVLSKIILSSGGYSFEVDYDYACDYIRKIAAGQVKENKVFEWIKKHSKQTEKESNGELGEFVKLLQNLA